MGQPTCCRTVGVALPPTVVKLLLTVSFGGFRLQGTVNVNGKDCLACRLDYAEWEMLHAVCKVDL